MLTTRNFIRICTEVKPEWYALSFDFSIRADMLTQCVWYWSVDRLLDFAPTYFDLTTMPDGETKRAIQRVIAKREGKLKSAGHEEKREKKKRKKTDKWIELATRQGGSRRWSWYRKGKVWRMPCLKVAHLEVFFFLLFPYVINYRNESL